MTKFKRSAIVLISALVALCAVFAFGCGGSDTGDDVGGDTEQTKYDVAIRLKCNDLEIYEFPIGTDEKHITIPYDGLDRSFWVDSYNLPAQNDTWSYISDKDAFEMSMTYCAPEGEPSAFYGSVKELGEYIITFETASAPDMWKPRRIELHITLSDAVGDIYYGPNYISFEDITKQVYRVYSEKDGFFRLSIDCDDVTVTEGADELADGTYLIHVLKDEISYLTLSNSARNIKDCCVTLSSDLEEISLSQTVNCPAGLSVVKFTNSGDELVRYNLTLLMVSDVNYNVKIYNESGNSESGGLSLEGNEVIYTFALEANQVCYIVSRFSDDCSFVINEDESPLGWVIMAEGQTMEEAFTRENRVYLERGAVYTAFLAEIDPSGAIEKKHYDYLAFPQDGVVYDDKNNELVIDSSALEEEELFITAQPYGYSLTIIFV